MSRRGPERWTDVVAAVAPEAMDTSLLPSLRQRESHDYDGRPKVGRDDDDPLLEQLYAVHKVPRPDIFVVPASKPPRCAADDSSAG